MNRRRFVAALGIGAVPFAGCGVLPDAYSDLSGITTISSYPYSVDDDFRLAANEYGGWKVAGSFVRSLRYRVWTEDGSEIDLLGFVAPEISAFENGDAVDALVRTTVAESETAGEITSPRSRTDFYFVLDNTGRGDVAPQGDVELYCSFEATTI